MVCATQANIRTCQRSHPGPPPLVSAAQIRELSKWPKEWGGRKYLFLRCRTVAGYAVLCSVCLVFALKPMVTLGSTLQTELHPKSSQTSLEITVSLYNSKSRTLVTKWQKNDLIELHQTLLQGSTPQHHWEKSIYAWLFFEEREETINKVFWPVGSAQGKDFYLNNSECCQGNDESL